MLLLADRVGLGEPRLDLRVDLGRPMQPEHVYLVPGRDEIDAPEARAVQPARQDHMAIDPAAAKRERGEAHPHLEGNARLLGQNLDRPVLHRGCKQSVEGCDDVGRAAFEVILEPDVAAEMRLVAIREIASAIRARPHRAHRRSLRSQLMAKIGVMIEGQEGLNWERWRRICHDADTLGFDSLRRSDHFFSVFGVPGRDCIECWSSLALAAEWTKRIEFGPMVSPMTFRPPAVLARIAAAVDVLSGGRLILGVGAGWYEQEHVENGLPFLTLKERMDLLESGITTIRATWKAVNPQPPRGDTIPLLMGGRGEKRAMPMMAREAAEWNVGFDGPDKYRHQSQVFDECCRAIGRDPSSVRRSVMTSYLIGRDRGELRERAGKIGEVVPRYKGVEPDEVLKTAAQSWLVGTPEQIAEQIREKAALGIDLFMLQHFLLDDSDALQLLAAEVIPAVA